MIYIFHFTGNSLRIRLDLKEFRIYNNEIDNLIGVADSLQIRVRDKDGNVCYISPNKVCAITTEDSDQST